MSRLFQPFAQDDESTTRQYGGTGLGLTITKEIVERMGGAITVRSQPGRGSSFSFTIEAELVHVEPGSGDLADPGVLEGKRVLVVDDNETNLRILRQVMSDWGMEVSVASSGPGALAMLVAGETFDVGILDYHMPAMSGLALARTIRSLPAHARMALVLLTSADLPADADSGDLVSSMLNKPVDPRRLARALVEPFRESLRPPARGAPQPGSEPPDVLGEAIPLRVLIAEDNEVNRRVLQLSLQRLGYSADEATDGGAAVEQVRGGAYDLVFMDLRMPVLGGDEAARIIRADTTIMQPRIVALTASASEEERRTCLDAGMDGFLTKPIKQDELRDALLDTGRARQSTAAGRSSVTGLRVLLVDDNATNRRVTELLLDLLGHQSIHASNGLEAVETAARSRFDLILMDCHMPVMDGIEAARRIRAADPQAPPIVALTAAKEETAASCAAVGMAGCLGKPFDLATLAAEIVRVTGRGDAS